MTRSRLTDRGSVVRTVLIAVLFVIAAGAIAGAAVHRGHPAYGYDFHGGIWKAGHDILAGRSPYRRPDAALLAHIGNPYIPPPLLAEVLIPIAVLPFAVSVALLNVICVAALIAAFHILGVRRRNLYAIALCSASLTFSLIYGDPDALYVLAAALAWRYRDSRYAGAVPIGVLIAFKLLLWPLVIWLLATRRVRQAGVAVASAIALLLGSWAVIGFKGLSTYPQLLAADAHVQKTNHSVLAALRAIGFGTGTATVIAISLALAVGLVVVRAGRGGDRAWFTAAILAGLIASPITFPNYLLILFVPLAISAESVSERLWLLTGALWLFLTPGSLRGAEWVIAAAIGAGIAMARRTTSADMLDLGVVPFPHSTGENPAT